MEWGTPVPTVRYRGSSPTHQTSGLSGYPAVDIMAPPGAPVVAPEDGYVYRLSGRPPQQGVVKGSVFGLSIYFKGRSGADYYMTHLGGYSPGIRGVTSSRPVRVRKGDPLGVIGDWPGDRGRSHLHLGVSGANPAAIASTPQTPRSGVGGTQAGTSGPKDGPLANVPVLGPAGRGVVSGLDWVLSPVDSAIDVAKSPFDAIKWIGGNWDRVLEVAAGFVLVLVGLVLLGRSLGIGRMGGGRMGDLANRVQYGPTVVQATRDPGLSKPQVVYTDEPSARPRRNTGYDPATADIPY